jgi:hypothetical protein
MYKNHMSKVIDRTKMPEIRDETDILAELEALKAENATLKTKLEVACNDYTRMKDSLPSFEKAVALKVAALGIGITVPDGGAIAHAAALTDSARALAAHNETLARMRKFSSK